MRHADLIHEQAPHLDRRLALIDRERRRTWSYAELDAAIARVAAALHGAGIGRDATVAVLTPNRAEVVLIWLACQRLAATFAPLDPRATPWELERRFALLRPALLCADRHAAIAVAAATRGAAAGPRLLTFDEAGPDGYDGWLAEAPRPFQGSAADPDAIGVVLFTSGSTATPRGARLPQRMLAGNATVTAAAWDLQPGDRALVAGPLWHAGGLGAFPLATWAAGGCVIVAAGFDAATYWGSIHALGVTATFGVPTLWQRAAAAPGFGAPTSLRLPLVGGAPAPLRLLTAYRQAGVPLRQGFGMSEAGINLMTASADHARAGLPGVGWPLPGVEADVEDDAGQPCPDDLVGELLIGGPFVAEGYLHAPEETAAVFLPDGRVRTGDLVVRRAHGFEVVGRLAHTYTTRGYTVSMAEVELALHDVAPLQAAAVVGVPDGAVGEVGVAFVVPAAGQRLDVDQLGSRLRVRLSRYKWPAAIVSCELLPETSTGKLDRAALRQRAVDTLSRRTP